MKDYIEFDIDYSKITVYLPETEYGELSIIERTGVVKFDGSDAAEIFVKTTAGNVTVSLLTDKVFVTKTDTGNINVPKIADGGKCEI